MARLTAPKPPETLEARLARLLNWQRDAVSLLRALHAPHDAKADRLDGACRPGCIACRTIRLLLQATDTAGT